MKAIITVTDPSLFKSISTEANPVTIPADPDDPESEAIEIHPEPGFIAERRTPIQIPTRLVGWFDCSKWRLAIHEAGHALAGLLYGGYCDGVALVNTGDGGEGWAYTNTPWGLPSARGSLAGIAAERLVEGDPLDLGFFDNDMKNARDDLLDAGVREDEVDAQLQALLLEVHHTFAESWTRALRDLADALFNRGFVHGDAVAQIVGRAQARLTKANPEPTRPYTDRIVFSAPPPTLTKACSQFNELAADLRQIRAEDLDLAASAPGLSAHEVAVLEAKRNRAATQAARIRRGQ